MTAILIPALNAAQTIGVLLDRIRAQGGRERVIVVDDGSGDDTSEIAREKGAIVLRHDKNKGKGAALKTGFHHVLSSSECDAVLTMDADLQHDPVEIPNFVAERSRSDADFVIGYRRRMGSGMPFHRILSNSITSALVSAKTGVEVRDSQSGYRLITRRVLTSIDVESDGYEAETEMLIKVARKGFRFGFVPIATIYAGAGSHMTHWRTTYQFLRVLLREYE